MEVANRTGVPSPSKKTYDRMSELKALDDTKIGVKGLVDSGVTEVPRMFFRPSDYFDNVPVAAKDQFKFPIIDLEGYDKDPVRRKEIVDQVTEASETWGFFQVTNHGIPDSVTEGMLEGVKRFFEQDVEEKKKWHTRDNLKATVYNCNFDLYRSPMANWRDSVDFNMSPKIPKPEELPEACREAVINFSRDIMNLGRTLMEFFSEGLGLHKDYLKDIRVDEGNAILCHYYPPCPQPEVTLGTSQHADTTFFTILKQCYIGGLQILHKGYWVDVPPTRGAVVVNIGDLLQLITNDRFISVEHRVIANRQGPRLSAACFFYTGLFPIPRLYEPIKELCSEESPPKYRPTSVRDFCLHFKAKGLNGMTPLARFSINRDT